MTYVVLKGLYYRGAGLVGREDLECELNRVEKQGWVVVSQDKYGIIIKKTKGGKLKQNGKRNEKTN